MNAVHARCEAAVAPPGSDLRYGLLGLDRDRRQTIIALHALQRELCAIRETVSDPAVAVSKLDWWEQELQRLHEGRPQHPVTRALAEGVVRYRLPADELRELAAAARMELEYDTYPSFPQFVVYCHRGGSSLALLRTRVLGWTQPDTAAFAHELGVMEVLAWQLLEVRDLARSGRCYLPEDELARFGIATGDLLSERGGPELAALFRFQAERIRAYHERALGYLAAADYPAQAPQLALAELILARLAEVEGDGFRLLHHRLELTPLRKFWLAWRALRRARRRVRVH
ncbi:MAG: squalene/phytoene synthase family protein [Candidatus Competibacterales bacterium]|nr:squalene/phytoene synthase family protein [Candidatus Competibacterales bacterium]